MCPYCYSAENGNFFCTFYPDESTGAVMMSESCSEVCDYCIKKSGGAVQLNLF